MELKVRVWSNDYNRVIYPERSECSVVIDGKNGWSLISHFTGDDEVLIPMNKEWDNIMLSTNREDKKGRIIYRGDIVRRMIKRRVDLPSGWEINFEEEISFIEWAWDGFCVHAEKSHWNWKDMEVIGNIFQDKQLLEN